MSSTSTEYGIVEHRHRFSVWAAARAAQRGFTTVENLRDALENSGIRKFLEESKGDLSDDAKFEEFHRQWCCNIMRFLQDRSVKRVTFGRSAKLVNMYIKSVVVLGSMSETTLARVAHPPIDAILLSGLSRKHLNKHWAKIKWTQLDERKYYDLIGDLRSILSPSQPFWHLEQFWTITRNT